MYIKIKPEFKEPYQIKKPVSKVLIHEKDSSEMEWYLVESQDSFCYDSTSDPSITRLYVDPSFQGFKNYKCTWVRKEHAERISFENNKEASSVLLKEDFL